MPALQHVYVTAHGSWKSNSAWYGEHAQFGLRLTTEASLAMPERGFIFTPGENGDVVLDQGTLAGDSGVLTRAWAARMGGVGSDNDWDAAAQLDTAEDVHTFLGSISPHLMQNFQWTHVKLCPVGVDGRALGHSSVYTINTPVIGAGTSQCAPQLAVAVSYRAPVIGRRGRGRIYLPAINSAKSDAHGRIDSTLNDGVRAAFVTLLGNLEDLDGVTDYNPCVAIMSAGSATAIRPTEVRVGNQFDTIKSRRQQIPETYTSTALS